MLSAQIKNRQILVSNIRTSSHDREIETVFEIKAFLVKIHGKGADLHGDLEKILESMQYEDLVLYHAHIQGDKPSKRSKPCKLEPEK